VDGSYFPFWSLPDFKMKNGSRGREATGGWTERQKKQGAAAGLKNGAINSSQKRQIKAHPAGNHLGSWLQQKLDVSQS
jgi:hypothetical protein